MRGFWIIVILLDLVVIGGSFFVHSPYFLLNTQLAFISSLLIVMGSFYGYKKVVQKRSATPGPDTIDQIEDRFGLYEEESPQEAKELFEREKERVKKGGALKHFFSTSSAFFSPYRLIGYGVLALMVLWLIGRGIFEPLSFLLGLAIVPVGTMLYALFVAKDQSSM